MAIFKINGVDPFAGYGDPFIGYSQSYEEMEGGGEICGGGSYKQNIAVYSIDINGVITGCTFDELNTIRDDIYDSFTPDRVESIYVTGLDLPAAASFKVDSINFQTSNYVGVVPYTISCTVKDKLPDDEPILSRTHKLDFNINAFGDNTCTYTIGAQGMETGDCSGLSYAVNWVTSNMIASAATNGEGLLKYNGIGTVKNPNQQMLLVTQSESIDRANSSYERSFNYKASKEDFLVVHDKSVTTDEAMDGCSTTKNYRGTFSFYTQNVIDPVFQKQKLFDAYNQYANSVLPSKTTARNVTYDSGSNSLNYSFSNPPPYAGELQVVYDYTSTTNTPEEGEKTYSVNGRAFCEVGAIDDRKDTLDAITDDSIITRMKGWAGAGLEYDRVSVSRDKINGEISFNGTFQKASVLNALNKNALDGVKGLSSCSISLTVPRHEFGVSYVLGCDPVYIDLNQKSRAQLSVSAVGVSGAKALGTTRDAIEQALKGYVLDQKNKFCTSPTSEKEDPPSFSLDVKGCATFSQSFSWETTNTANSASDAKGIISNLRG